MQQACTDEHSGRRWHDKRVPPAEQGAPARSEQAMHGQSN